MLISLQNICIFQLDSVHTAVKTNDEKILGDMLPNCVVYVLDAEKVLNEMKSGLVQKISEIKTILKHIKTGMY